MTQTFQKGSVQTKKETLTLAVYAITLKLIKEIPIQNAALSASTSCSQMNLIKM